MTLYLPPVFNSAPPMTSGNCPTGWHPSFTSAQILDPNAQISGGKPAYSVCGPDLAGQPNSPLELAAGIWGAVAVGVLVVAPGWGKLLAVVPAWFAVGSLFQGVSI